MNGSWTSMIYMKHHRVSKRRGALTFTTLIYGLGAVVRFRYMATANSLWSAHWSRSDYIQGRVVNMSCFLILLSLIFTRLRSAVASKRNCRIYDSQRTNRRHRERTGGQLYRQAVSLF